MCRRPRIGVCCARLIKLQDTDEMRTTTQITNTANTKKENTNTSRKNRTHTCISEKQNSSFGISSGLALALTAKLRISSNTAKKSVLQPQKARCKEDTRASRDCPSITCHCGTAENVITRPPNGGDVISATSKPRAMATSMGKPCIDPRHNNNNTVSKGAKQRKKQ